MNWCGKCSGPTLHVPTRFDWQSQGKQKKKHENFQADPYAVYPGFYIQSALFPKPKTFVKQTTGAPIATLEFGHLLLGPFCGKPACQFINIEPPNAKGVCANAFMTRETVLVPDVEAYPGHIACDGETKSEVVCPLVVRVSDHETMTVGVLDLDCLALNGFSEEDKVGLEKIAQLVANACDW